MEKLILLFIFYCFLSVGRCAKDEFNEELIVKPLASGHLAVNFRFVTERFRNLDNHYDLFPKVIGELLQQYNLEELHLSLVQGFWRVQQWGYAPQPPAPTGAQVWAWFGANNKSLDIEWRNLIHSLSGYFCASLSQMVPQLTAIPEFAFRPVGVLSSSLENDRIRYAALPSENVCTENLTPWEKLLPCKQMGLSALLNPVKLYDSHYNSLSIHVRKTCNAKKCKTPKWELILSLTVVFDAPVMTRIDDWSFRSLFDSSVQYSCPLADNSNVFVDVTNKLAKFDPQPTETIIDRNGRNFAKFDLSSENLRPTVKRSFDLESRLSQRVSLDMPYAPHINLHTYLAGTGLEHGKLVTRLVNTGSANESVLFSHVIPWFLRIYLHTMRIECSDGSILKPLFRTYHPSKDRQQPHYLEIALSLPSNIQCHLSIEFEKAFLRWTEYPPDAHHGFWVPAPSITFNNPRALNETVPLGGYGQLSDSLSSKSSINKVVTVFGEALLVNLPTPDFSMPYNVICLVCTVVALCFGPIHNLTTRSLVLQHPDALKEKGIKAKIRNILAKLKAKFWRKKESIEEKTKTE